ncbi:MAG TPA: M15 family metallopeptidase [Acidimicrobiia bacterium]|nr:M15 family metallopeptidase [Acidimicrobiia bacterium]
MSRRSARTWPVTLVAALLALAACSAPPDEAGPTSSSSSAGSSTTDGPAPTSSTLPDGPYAPEPDPPVGPLPSFNESAGCTYAQGVRGPYASVVSGALAGTEAVWGPWGDFYGRDLDEVRGRLVEVALPMTGDREVTVWVHEAVLPALEAAIANLEAEEAAGNYYEIRRGDVSSFRPETVWPKRYLSFHAVGAAIDINASNNPYSADNELTTDLPDWFVAAWTGAGWCWGGDWQSIKDPMHFSWRGPLYTAGYPATTPVAPRTAAGRFLRSLIFPTVLGPAPDGSHLFVIDVDRDGAPDAVRVHPWTAAGHLGVEIAQAMYEFRTGCTPLVTSPAAAGATLLMADGTGDARPDLWEIDSSGEDVVVIVHTLASGYSRRLEPRRTGVTADPGLLFLAGDHDRDGSTDLYVVGDGMVEVWQGPAFASRLLQADLPAAVGQGWRFALGDRDVDGVPDLFALSPDDPARLLIMSGAAGLAGETETITTAVSGHDGAMAAGDLDGDGRADLYFLDPDGTLTVYLGGGRGGTPDEDLIYWFVEGDDQPATRQEACPVVPEEPAS